MIQIYGKENCSNCKILKNILDDRNIPYNYIEDIKTLMIIGSKEKIMSAPIISYNSNFYSMTKFLEVINL